MIKILLFFIMLFVGNDLKGQEIDSIKSNSIVDSIWDVSNLDDVTCGKLKAIVSIDLIKDYIIKSLSESAPTVRIFDIDNNFGQGDCYSSPFTIKVLNKLQLDVNTSRYTDIILFDRKDLNDSIEKFSVFYYERSSTSLNFGYVLLKVHPHGTEVLEYKISPMQ